MRLNYQVQIMAKSAKELIEELKEGKLTTFWITRDDDVPWIDKVTLVSKSQQAEILDLTLKNLKDQKVLKVKEGKRIGVRPSGFCKPGDDDLSDGFYSYMMERRDKDTDFLVYTVDGKYAGASVLMTRHWGENDNPWGIYVNLLCSIKPGTGTKILTMIKEAIKTQGKNKGYIELNPLDSAVGFYKKLGFSTSQMRWYRGREDEKLEVPTKGGLRKNGLLTRKLNRIKNAKITSRNLTQKSRKLVR